MSQYITTTEAAKLLGLTTIRRVRQLIETGKLKAVKFGRDWQVDKESLEEYIKKRSREE